MSAPEIHPSLPGDATIDLPAAFAPLSFWQRPFVQNVLPLCTSMLLHAAVIIMGIATYRVVIHLAKPVIDQVNVPEMFATNPDATLGIPGRSGNNEPIFQEQFMNVKALDGVSSTPGRDLSRALSGGPTGDGRDSAELAIGLTASHAGGGPGNSLSGVGDGPGGPGGGLAPFGVPHGGTGHGGGTDLFPCLPVSHQKIVYVLDATGSMMASFDALRGQVRTAIQNLRPPMSFNIVFINEHNPAPLAPGLFFATPEAKRKAVEYVDTMAPRAGTNPLPALEKAFAMQPDLIYMLIDPSDFPDRQAVLDLVAAKSSGGKIKLSILAFEGHDAANEAFLKSLAESTGGKYRFITEQDLLSPR